MSRRSGSAVAIKATANRETALTTVSGINQIINKSAVSRPSAKREEREGALPREERIVIVERE